MILDAPATLSGHPATTAEEWLEKCLTAELASTCQDHNEIMVKLYGINAVSLLDSTDATEQDGPITPDSAPPPDAPAVQPGYRILSPPVVPLPCA